MELSRANLIKNVEEALELKGMRHFINKESFDLLSYPDELDALETDIDLFDDVIKEIEENPEDYIEIEPITSSEGFIIMEDFTDTIHNIYKQSSLMKALNKRNPFRQFRYALEDTNLTESWNNYEKKAYKNMASRWVDAFLKEEKLNI